MLYATIVVKGQDRLSTIKKFTVQDGLVSNNFYHSFGDSTGFIWFTSDAGVYRFDGKHFDHYGVSNGLCDNDVLGGFCDSRGRVWFYGFNGCVSYFENNKLYNFSDVPFLDSLSISTYYHNITEDQNGNLWFLPKHNNLSKNITIKYLTPENVVKEIQFTKNSQLGSVQAIQLLDNQKLMIWAYREKYVLSKEQVKLLTVSNFNNMGNSVFKCNGRIVYSTRDNQLLKYYSDQTYDSIYVENGIVDIVYIYEDSKDQLWLSTLNDGITIYKTGFDNYHSPYLKLLNGIPVVSVVEDDIGNYWVCSLHNGVYKIENNHLNNEVDTHKFKLMDQKVDALVNIKDHVLALNRLTFPKILKNEKFKELQLSDLDNFKEVVMYDCASQLGPGFLSIDGEIVTWDYHVIPKSFRNLNKKKIENFEQGYQYRVVLNDSCFILADRFSVSTIECAKNDICKVKKTWVMKSKASRIFINSIGQLIISCENNVLTIDENNELVSHPWSRITNKNKILSHEIYNETTDIIGVEGQGVLFVTNDSVVYRINKENGLSSNHIGAMTLGTNGLWVGYIDKYAHIKFENKNDTYSHQIRIADDSFDGKILSLLETNNALFVATANGVWKTEMDNIKYINSNHKPKNYFKNWKVNNVSRSFQDRLIKYGKQNIEFELGTINFTNNPITDYKYRLVGSDTTWNKTSASQVVYSNLSPKKYIFEFTSNSNHYPNYAEVERFDFEILPLWYQHKSVLPLSVLAFGLAIVLFSRQLVSRRKQKEIEMIKTEKQLLLLEQQALRALMNPHFVYNAMSSIQHFLYANDPHTAATYLAKFAKLIRMNLEATSEGFNSLKSELEKLDIYVDLEKLRLEEDFLFHIICPDNLLEEDILIPSMMLQPLVENAILHGVSKRKSNGEIKVVVQKQTDKTICIQIEDNGPGLVKLKSETNSQKKKHKSLGTTLLEKRLKNYSKDYEEALGLTFKSLKNNNGFAGTRAQIILPVTLV